MLGADRRVFLEPRRIQGASAYAVARLPNPSSSTRSPVSSIVDCPILGAGTRNPTAGLGGESQFTRFEFDRAENDPNLCAYVGAGVGVGLGLGVGVGLGVGIMTAIDAETPAIAEFPVSVAVTVSEPR
jgi:hypothetical protein